MNQRLQEKKPEHPRRGRRRALARTINTLPIYVLLALLFIAYFAFQQSPSLSIIFGAALFFTIIILLILEVTNGAREEGTVKNAMEIAVAIILVVVLWFGMRAVLNTTYPLDVVPSCSMLPVLNRGDMIVLQGANQSSLNAPIINVNGTQWNASFANLSKEALQCVAYSKVGGRVSVSQLVRPGYSVGLLRTNGVTGLIVPYNYQQNNTVKYICGTANVLFQNGTMGQEAYTTGIVVGNTTIRGDRNNSIIVYQTIPQDAFYKDGDSYIVHRVYAIVNASGRFYVLTKGDNNPGLDVQYQNYPIAMSYVGGKTIASLPYVGYLKLILSNNFAEPAGCNSTVVS